MKHFRQICKTKHTKLLVLLLLIFSIGYTQTTTPIVGVPTYYNGPAAGNTNPGFITVFYNPAQGGSSLSSGASSITKLANAEHIGTTWGTAYDPRINTFYTGAVLKRHAGYAGSSGAIYKINAANTTPGASLLIDLNGKTGTLPGGGTSSPIDCGNAASEHGTLNFSASQDAVAYALAGKTSLGDIDISPTSNTLWVVNVKQRQLISINISNPSSPVVDKVFPINTASTGVTATDGEIRPWGLEVSNSDDVYIGLVATAENVTPAAPTTGSFNAASTTTRENPTNRAKLRGYVFKLNKATGAFTQLISFPLDYNRASVGLGGFGNIPLWVPWFDDYTQGLPNLADASTIYQFYPQPLVSDIEILDDGSMLVAIMDRFGLQAGSEANTKPDGSSGENGRPCGDLVRFLSTGTNTWNNTINNFYGDGLSFFENEAALGSIAYKSGTSEFIATAIDAIGPSSNGLAVRDLNNNILDDQDIISNNSTTGIPASSLLAAKGNALGDIEIGFVGPQICINPILYSAQEQVGTCTGLTPNNDGAIVLKTVAAGDKVGYVIGNSYTGGAPYSTATPITSLPFNLVSNIPNAGTTYTIRVFNGSDACYKDTTITTTIIYCGPIPPMATVGNYVWNDENGDGLNNEPPSEGINGVLVELWKETSPGSGVYAFYATKTTANDGSGNPGYYNFDVPLTANFKMKFPTTLAGGKALAPQTITAGTDNNSDASIVDGFTPVFALDPAGTGLLKNNPTIDAGFICSNGIITTNFATLVAQPVPIGQGLVYTGGAACSGTGTFNYDVPINIPTAPTGTSPFALGTANMPALPAGAVVTAASIVIPNITTQNSSNTYNLRIDLTGAITHTGTVGTGTLTGPNTGIFTYLNDVATANVNIAGGIINVFYREPFDFGPGPDASFTLGTPAAGAFIKLTYTAPKAISWYTTSKGGLPIGTGSPFNPVGVAGSGIANTNTLGDTKFYIACNDGSTCRVPVTFSIQAVLPVTLVDLNLTNANCKATLSWKSSSEISFNKYEVEYSSNGVKFDKIATIKGKGNNSNYSFTNEQQQSGKVFYRIKMINNDGNEVYSNILNTNIECNQKSFLVYPNPADNVLNINLQGYSGNIVMYLKTSAGQLLKKETLQNGSNSINVQSLATGNYMVVIADDKGKIEYRKINIVKK